jgi:hypothetical protein
MLPGREKRRAWLSSFGDDSGLLREIRVMMRKSPRTWADGMERGRSQSKKASALEGSGATASAGCRQFGCRNRSRCRNRLGCRNRRAPNLPPDRLACRRVPLDMSDERDSV